MITGIQTCTRIRLVNLILHGTEHFYPLFALSLLLTNYTTLSKNLK